MAKSIKLTYTTTFSLEVSNEDELQMAIRNMPWLASQPGFNSAQSNVRHIESINVPQILSMADAEKQAIINALQSCGTKTKAAAMLGIQRSTLNVKIKEYGVIDGD
jgi:DNA-binding NtrC family response regulator